MDKPYIYKITNIDTGDFYIGSQCQGKTIGKNYWTSSTNKEFVFDFKHNTDAYLIKIIATFADKESCVLEENIMIKRHFNDKGCLNKAYVIGKNIGFGRQSKIPWNKGKCTPNETKKKLSESHKGLQTMLGKHMSEETKEKISEAKKGGKAWNKGLSLSEIHKKNLSISHKGQRKGKHWKTVDGKRVWY